MPRKSQSQKGADKVAEKKYEFRAELMDEILVVVFGGRGRPARKARVVVPAALPAEPRALSAGFGVVHPQWCAMGIDLARINRVTGDDREARRRRRLGEPMRAYAVGDEPGDDLSGTTTAAERLAMMWPLARRCWLLMGRTVPSYRRGEMPGTIVRARR